MTREFDRKEKEEAKYLLDLEANRALKAENDLFKEKVERLEAKVKSLRLKLRIVKELKEK
jgi:hypothetical protein